MWIVAHSTHYFQIGASCVSKNLYTFSLDLRHASYLNDVKAYRKRNELLNTYTDIDE